MRAHAYKHTLRVRTPNKRTHTAHTHTHETRRSEFNKCLTTPLSCNLCNRGRILYATFGPNCWLIPTTLKSSSLQIAKAKNSLQYNFNPIHHHNNLSMKSHNSSESDPK